MSDDNPFLFARDITRDIWADVDPELHDGIDDIGSRRAERQIIAAVFRDNFTYEVFGPMFSQRTFTSRAHSDFWLYFASVFGASEEQKDGLTLGQVGHEQMKHGLEVLGYWSPLHAQALSKIEEMARADNHTLALQAALLRELENKREALYLARSAKVDLSADEPRSSVLKTITSLLALMANEDPEDERGAFDACVEAVKLALDALG